MNLQPWVNLDQCKVLIKTLVVQFWTTFLPGVPLKQVAVVSLFRLSLFHLVVLMVSMTKKSINCFRGNTARTNPMVMRYLHTISQTKWPIQYSMLQTVWKTAASLTLLLAQHSHTPIGARPELWCFAEPLIPCLRSKQLMSHNIHAKGQSDRWHHCSMLRFWILLRIQWSLCVMSLTQSLAVVVLQLSLRRSADNGVTIFGRLQRHYENPSDHKGYACTVVVQASNTYYINAFLLGDGHQRKQGSTVGFVVETWSTFRQDVFDVR